jgi:uncharacterized protein (TIGR02117 family)
MTAHGRARTVRLARAVLFGFFRGCVLLAFTLVLAAVLTARSGDRTLFPALAESVPIHLVSHGYHSGLVLPRPVVATLAEGGRFPALARLAERFGAYPFIEVGWGEAEFYRQVPTLDAVQFPMAARALFRPGNGSVLHVVGVSGEPRQVFDAADIVRLPLSPAGLERLLFRLEAAFAREAEAPVELGPGLYGPSLFYRATETFSIFRVCNHWTAGLLHAAGVPTAPVLATFPQGLIWDLRLRSGLRPLPPPG